MNIELEVKNALAELKKDLATGDEIITQIGGSGKVIRHSKKVGEHRVKFIQYIMTKLSNSEITTQDANKATNLFGKKTTSIYWIKN